MELSGEGGRDWICDVCGEEGTGEAWRCTEDKRWGRGGRCDYDVCSGCRQEYKVSRWKWTGEAQACFRWTLPRTLAIREQDWRLRKTRRQQVTQLKTTTLSK